MTDLARLSIPRDPQLRALCTELAQLITGLRRFGVEAHSIAQAIEVLREQAAELDRLRQKGAGAGDGDD